MSQQQSIQYPEYFNGNSQFQQFLISSLKFFIQKGNESISSDTIYLKERFKNNIESFNNTVQGLKQCMEQINRNQRDNSNQRIDKYSRVEQMLVERRNKLNTTNQSSICQNTERFNIQSLSKNNQSLSSIQQIQNNLAIINQQSSIKSDLVKPNKDEQSLNNNIVHQNFSKLKNLQQQYQNILEPDEEQYQNESSCFLREGVEELIKQKSGVYKINREGLNNIEQVKTERDSFGSTLFQIESSSFQGIQRLSEIHERKTEQFLQEFEDEDSIALPENICRLFPESSQTIERNRISELEREMERKQNCSLQNDSNSNNFHYRQEYQNNGESQQYRYEEQNYQSFQSQQDQLCQTQQELYSGENSTILQEINAYQFYSNQQHVLPIEDRLYVKNLNREEKIKQLQEIQEQKMESELQKIPKITKQSDIIARNSSRFQENPDLVTRLMNDKYKKEYAIKQKQCQQISEDEHRFTFAPQINQQSHGLNRSVENLYQWEQYRKIKQTQTQKQIEKQEEENIQKMKQQSIICEGSKKIVEHQARSTEKVENRLIREGQQIQAKKKLLQEKENEMIKQMSNQKNMKRSMSNISGINSQSKLDQSSHMNTTNKTLSKQYSVDKICNTKNFKNQPQSYILYCPNNFENENSQQGTQIDSQIENTLKLHDYNSNNKIQNEFGINYNQQFDSTENNLSQQTLVHNKQLLQDITNNIQFNQYENNQQNAQKQGHHKTYSLQINKPDDGQKNQIKLAYPLNLFKKSEKIVLPKSVNGKVSVESLVQSAQFRKTKIFATDNQNMIILDKSDSIPLSNKNQDIFIQLQTKIQINNINYNQSFNQINQVNTSKLKIGQSQKKKKEECQIIDINQLLLNKQDSSGTNKAQKVDLKNTFKVLEEQSQKENIPKTGRTLSKQFSQVGLGQNKGTIPTQQNIPFIQQIKNEKISQTYTTQYQKKKLQRTNSCLTNKYFSNKD